MELVGTTLTGRLNCGIKYTYATRPVTKTSVYAVKKVSSSYIITLIWNYNSVNMATLNKTMTLTMAIVFLTIVCASDIPSSSNTSFNVSSNATSTHPCGTLYYIIYGPLSCTVYAFGLIGNSLSFAVLHKYTSGNVGTYLLKALAVTDNIFLAVTLISARIEPFVPEKMLYVIVALLNASLSWTVWMIVLVAGNRYIAVCRPMMASRLCTISKVRLEILIMAAAVCVFNMPHLIDYCIMDNETIIFENMPTHEKVACEGMFYYIIYANALHCIFVFILPLALIIFFNVHLMRSLKVAQRSRKAMSSRSRRDDNNITQCSRMAMTSLLSSDENNITVVMIVIIIVFVVCQAPMIMSIPLIYFNDWTLICSSQVQFYFVSRLLVTVNSCACWLVIFVVVPANNTQTDSLTMLELTNIC